jgi:nucleotide-binding universal stress UspA family protein
MTEGFFSRGFRDEHHAEDHEAGRRIACPLLASWGRQGYLEGHYDVLEVWRGWPRRRGVGVKQLAPVLKEALERRLEQQGRELLDGEVERVRSAGGTVAQSHLMIGEVAREIVHLAEALGAGLIVMGSRGHGGINRALMGSVSESVVRHAHCPVTIVRE